MKYNNAIDKVNNKAANLLLPILMAAVDYAALVCAEGAAYELRNAVMGNQLLHISWLSFWIINPAIFFIFLNIAQLYSRRMQFWKIIEKIFHTACYSILSLVLLLYVAQTAASISRLFVVLFWLFSFILLVCGRYLVKRIIEIIPLLQIPILIIGAGKTAELFVQGISSDAGMGYKIIGLLEDNKVSIKSLKKYPVLGKFSDAEKIIAQTGVQNVVIAAPGMEQAKLTELINRIQSQVKNLTIIPNLIDIPMSGIEAEGFFNEKIMLLRLKNNLASPLNRFMKYSFDFIATLIGVILISPILLAITILIKLDSPGDATFKHTRIGKDGKPFGCWKFRTMCVDADKRLAELLATSAEARKEWEESFKLKNDPRVTKVGKFLRKTSLDELPQVFNVLKGEMSLVGPRPVIVDELPRYGEYLDDYLMVRPGITGMWQVNGRSDTTYDERVRMDSWYVRNWSFWIDIMLLWRTVKAVVCRKGAY